MVYGVSKNMKKKGRVWKRGVGYGLCYDRSIGKG